MSINDEFIDRVLDGDASDAEAAQLQEWLKVPENLQQFALRGELHSDLRRSLRRRCIQTNALEANQDASAITFASASLEHPAPVFRSRRMLLLSVTGLVTAACLLITFMRHEGNGVTNHGDIVAATVISNVSGLLTKGDQQWDDAKLSVGDYELHQGLLHLRFDGGVMVYVEAPARFDVLSGKRLVLHQGRLSANVPPEGTGFTVDTPEAEVIDFGTEFSLDVASGTSEVHVFDGLVRVRPKSRQGAKRQAAIDLRTSQAVKINDKAEEPVEIKLATDRFIRTFDESRRRYSRTVKSLSAVAFYRMAIRDQGLACQPPQYSGVVLMGDGRRPPHARGVFSGGSLLVLADSTGRGGRVDTPPPLRTGQLTLATFVYREANSLGGIVATNIHKDGGNFSLALNEQGVMQATIRNSDGRLLSVSSDSVVALQQWRHVVMTADGDIVRLYEDGRQVASAPCSPVTESEAGVLWFGTNSDGMQLWDGRIDEVALFDHALGDADVRELYQAALEELGKSE